MSKKTKFKPRVARIRLAPEQAVLQCDCYDTGYRVVDSGGGWPPGIRGYEAALSNICGGKIHMSLDDGAEGTYSSTVPTSASSS